MTLDYDRLMALPPMQTRHHLTRKDTILYALGVGAASTGAQDTADLPFVYEERLVALPTMAAVLAYPGFWAKEPAYGLTWQKILHGEQSIEFHRPIPVEGEFLGVTTIDEIFDKGLDKGALMHSSRRIYDGADNTLIATVRQLSFLRGDGGFGGKPPPQGIARSVPDRPADLTIAAPTRLDQALLYRLSGDANPLHIDPVVARQAGFDAPILHGLATYAVAGRVALKSLCGNQPERMRRYEVRFTKPVYPGDTLDIEIWHLATGRAALRASARERGVVVLQNGYIEYDA